MLEEFKTFVGDLVELLKTLGEVMAEDQSTFWENSRVLLVFRKNLQNFKGNLVRTITKRQTYSGEIF